MAKSKRICCVSDCSKNVVANDLCEMHYRRVKRHGTLEKKEFQPRVCLVDGCCGNASAPGAALGYCPRHYNRLKRNGDPMGGKRSPGELLEWLQGMAQFEGDECLIFPGAAGKSRGTVGFGGRQINASRAMCILAHGEPPSPELYACHTCRGGNDGCVNPQHLYWGTPTQNQADRIKDGTSNRGERAPSVKLSEQDVLKIKGTSGLTNRELAANYGVRPNAISRIRSGARWGWI